MSPHEKNIICPCCPFIPSQSPPAGPRNLWWRLRLRWLWNRCLWSGWGGGRRPGWRGLGPTQEADKEEAREEEHFWDLRAQRAREQSYDGPRQWDPHHRYAREVPGVWMMRKFHRSASLWHHKFFKNTVLTYLTPTQKEKEREWPGITFGLILNGGLYSSSVLLVCVLSINVL